MSSDADAPAGALRPDAAELADGAARWRGAYVHVPFCARRCPYCDFAVVTPQEGGRPDGVSRYVDALCVEVGMEPEWEPLDALYVGGGTPSRLSAGRMRRVVAAIEERFGLAPGAEISLEANPEDWTPELASGLAAAGFNRVSFGVQSFDPAVLDALGRGHRPEQGSRAVAVARAAGFASVNVDLIFGTPGETAESWRATLARVAEAGPDHLSGYALTVERGTALSRAVMAGAPGPDPDDQADKYEIMVEAAAQWGLVRYEVSNFAAPGHACRYNLLTWAQGEYAAFGLGAHGHRAGTRRRNVRRFDAYLSMVAQERRPEAGRDTSGDWDRERERLYLGIRRSAGVALGRGGARLLESADGERLQRAGVLSAAAGRLYVMRPLLTDEVSRAVLSLSPGDC